MYIYISLKSTQLFDHKDLAFAPTEQMKAILSLCLYSLPYTLFSLFAAGQRQSPPWLGLQSVPVWAFGCLHPAANRTGWKCQGRDIHSSWEMEITAHDPATRWPGPFCCSSLLGLEAHKGTEPVLSLSKQHKMAIWDLERYKEHLWLLCLNAGYLHPSFPPWQRGKCSSSLPHTGKYKAENYSYYNCLWFETKFKGLSSLINLPPE